MNICCDFVAVQKLFYNRLITKLLRFRYKQFSKKGIKKVVICRKANRISKKIINRFEKEYGPIAIKEDKTYHDRFLIIDNEIYLMGTSLNSIGHKTSSVIKCSQFNIKDIIKDE